MTRTHASNNCDKTAEFISKIAIIIDVTGASGKSAAVEASRLPISAIGRTADPAKSGSRGRRRTGDRQPAVGK